MTGFQWEGKNKVEEKKFDILMVLQVIFAIPVLLISIYGLMTKNDNLQPVSFILMGVMFLLIGLREYKDTQSLFSGMFYLCISLFTLFVGIEGIIIN